MTERYTWRAVTNTSPPAVIAQTDAAGDERAFPVQDAVGVVLSRPGHRAVAVMAPTDRGGQLRRFRDRIVSVTGDERGREVIEIATDPPLYVLVHDDGTVLVAGSPYAELLVPDATR